MPMLSLKLTRPLEVERVVERRAGRMELDEALERRERLRLLAALPEVIGALDLRLLRQQRSGGTPSRRS
jgi:hypothetical protein